MIDDYGHNKAMKLKVKAFEVVDTMVAHLAYLLSEAKKKTGIQYSICIIGNHFTPMKYEDYTYKPIPFTICQVKDFVKAKNSKDVVLATKLTPFNSLQGIEATKFTIILDENSKDRKAVVRDFVVRYGEIAIIWRCFGWFTRSKIMDIIIKHYMAMNTSTIVSA